MATDVHKPISTNPLAKPTSQATTPPSRDHKCNNNQTIPTTTAKDRPDPPRFSVSKDNFHKMTDQDIANVNKPSSSDYPTKLTPPISPPPCRDHQHKNNQTIPTITTKDQNFDIPAGVSPSNQDNFHKMTLEELMYDERCSPGVFASHPDVNKMTLEEQMEQYNEKCCNYFDNFDAAKVIPILPGMFNTFDTDNEFTTTTTDEASDTTTSDAATINAIASSPTETKLQPEFNTDNKFTAPSPTTITTTEEEEEEEKEEKEEVRTIIDHEFYTTCDRTNEASDTTITATTIEDEFTTSSTIDIPNIMENTTTVHTTDNAPTTHTTTAHAFSDFTVRTTNTTNTNKVIETPIMSSPPTSNNYYDNIDHKILRSEDEGTIVFEEDPSALTTTVTNKKKKKQKKALQPEQREAFAQELSLLTKLIDENTGGYVFELLVKDPFDEEDTRELVCGILMETLLS